MKTLNDLSDVSGKTIFVRTDFNVPIVDGKVGDDFRIQKSFKTIDALLAQGAKLVLASHIEGPVNTLAPVAEYLKKKYKIAFIPEYFPNFPKELESVTDNDTIYLLDNLRKYSGEKGNDEAFAKHLAGFADFYVNEAFPSSHRAHASIVGIPKYIPGFAGLVFEEEIKELSRAFHPAHPFLFIIGGAKFETKLPLFEKFFAVADKIFVGGALANDFFKARGLNSGKSVVSDGTFHLEKFLTDKLILPIDVVVESTNGKETKLVEEVMSTDIIYDVGPKSIEALNSVISEARFILWNGPLGNYEKGFKEGTEALAKVIAQSRAETIVGGGDTIASIAELNLTDKFSFISTGGGAMLDFLANETLPGVEALNNSKQ
jgi:phosphoglycerate kinase